jgi:hypothetical protein
MTRLENLPGPVALKRMMAAMVELFCDGLPLAPAITIHADPVDWRERGQKPLFSQVL